jgi:hypothetical protein
MSFFLDGRVWHLRRGGPLPVEARLTEVSQDVGDVILFFSHFYPCFLLISPHVQVDRVDHVPWRANGANSHGCKVGANFNTYMYKTKKIKKKELKK